MKTTRKILALVIAMLLVSAMAVSAFAVTITITRDSSYDGTGSGTGNAYTWYKVFSATPANTSGSTTGEGGSGSYYFSSGSSSGMTTNHTAVAYVASADVYSKINAAGGNEWFTLTPIEGKDTYSVAWNAEKTSASDIQAAAEWIVSNKIFDETGTLTWNGTDGWADDVDAGYYVIEGLTGKNLVAATTNITIKEKNVYPSLDKTQKDEDTSEYGSGTVNVAIGDTIDYQIEVKVPATAKAEDWIEVWDKVTEGLTLNGDIEAKVGGTAITIEDGTTSGKTWAKKFQVNSGTAPKAGDTVVFTFKMTVNDSALVDTGKKNEAALKYGHGSGSEYESIPDEVEYKTYLTGIKKIDGADSGTLAGVTFKLVNASGTELAVTEIGSGEYKRGSGTGSGTGRVTTNASGTILIRGLDDDKTYQLVEIETLPGYNMLDKPVDLVLTEDTSGTAATYTSWQNVVNNKGTVLPSTGGIGTTIIYIAGAILALGAAILLVAKRRAN